MEAPSLTFTSFDTTEIGSIAHQFAGSTPDQLCGIYVLRFAKHRRSWPDIVSLEFASASASAGLGEAQRGAQVRNPVEARTVRTITECKRSRLRVERPVPFRSEPAPFLSRI